MTNTIAWRFARLICAGRLVLLLSGLALPAARQEQLQLSGLMVDTFGRPTALARVTVGAGITVTSDAAGGVVLSVETPAALVERIEQLEQLAGVWRPLSRREDGSWMVDPKTSWGGAGRLPEAGTWVPWADGRRLTGDEWWVDGGYLRLTSEVKVVRIYRTDSR